MLTTGAQPEIFQGGEGFMELGHFDKFFVKNTRKKVTQGNILELFLLDTLFQIRAGEASPLAQPTSLF